MTNEPLFSNKLGFDKEDDKKQILWRWDNILFVMSMSSLTQLAQL